MAVDTRTWAGAYRDGAAGGGAWARFYKLPCSIISSAPAMTLGGIELSANGSIRPKPDLWHWSSASGKPLIDLGRDLGAQVLNSARCCVSQLERRRVGDPRRRGPCA